VGNQENTPVRMADPRVTLKREDFPETTGGELTARQILPKEWVGIS